MYPLKDTVAELVKQLPKKNSRTGGTVAYKETIFVWYYFNVSDAVSICRDLYR